MSWILIAVGAYFILSLTNLLDKFLLDKALPDARAYTFLVNIMGGAVILAAPWLLYWPGWQLVVLNLLVGAIFPFALLLLYQALKAGEPSKVLVLIGACVPVFTLLLSMFFLKEVFTFIQWLALVGLILGAALIAWLPPKITWLTRLRDWLGFGQTDQMIGILEAVGSALLFAIVMTASKALYTVQNFSSAFIWLRLGSALAVLLLLLSKPFRRAVFKNLKKLKGANAGLFGGNQLLAATGFTLQNYALSLGSVAIVNALQSVQYAFLLIFGAILSVWLPKNKLGENISAGVIVQKLIAICLIGLSLFLLIS
jgi:drug/metabolite transporter (DMT)-like permease